MDGLKEGTSHCTTCLLEFAVLNGLFVLLN